MTDKKKAILQTHTYIGNDPVDLPLWLEKDEHAEMYVLRAQPPGESEPVGILGISSEGITVFDGNAIEGLPFSHMEDADGNQWAGITVSFDATSLDTDNLADHRVTRD